MLIFSAWSARRSLREQIGAARRRVEMQKEERHDDDTATPSHGSGRPHPRGRAAATAFALTAFQDNLSITTRLRMSLRARRRSIVFPPRRHGRGRASSARAAWKCASSSLIFRRT